MYFGMLNSKMIFKLEGWLQIQRYLVSYVLHMSTLDISNKNNVTFRNPPGQSFLCRLPEQYTKKTSRWQCMCFLSTIKPENSLQNYRHAQFQLFACLFVFCELQNDHTWSQANNNQLELMDAIYLISFLHCCNMLMKSFTLYVTHSTTVLGQKSRCESQK